MKFLWCAALAATLSAQTFSGAAAIDDTLGSSHRAKAPPRSGAHRRPQQPDCLPQSLWRPGLGPANRAHDARHHLRLASLTKVIATTSSLMKLFEQGKFRLNDKITQYIPEFQGGKSDITIRNLFTHFSGLKPDVASHSALERLRNRHPHSPVPIRLPVRPAHATSIATSISSCSASWSIA